MNRRADSCSDALPVTVQIAIDRRCTDFERAVGERRSPEIEDYLVEFSGSAREKALEELIALDLDDKVARGEAPSLEHYRKRFPADLQMVKSVYLSALVPQRIGAFRVDGVLGTGGFGRVYLAYDVTLKRPVAIKMLLGNSIRSRGGVEELLREARLAAKLRHPSIVRVYEVGQDEDGDRFIVLEYIDGRPLDRVLDDGKPAPSRIVEVMIKIAQALQYAHDHGLTHRDLKPSNVLLDKHDEPYITDFGLAIDETTERLRAGEVAGTPPYMAPEQVAGESHRIDGRTDIWALGVIVYELLSGHRPYHGADRDELFYSIRYVDPKPLHEVDPSIPVELDRIALKCMAKRMTDRYAKALDVAVDLKTVLRALQLGPSKRFETDNGQLGSAVASGGASGSLPPVVPKGLRSFEWQDAEFFLRLLPGPKDLHGIPESLRFWQWSINDRSNPAAFPIGLIYGPSGSGKSSFVKAGLLPGLADHVIPVFVEATRDESELRLLKALRAAIPGIPAELPLPDIIAGLRERLWIRPDAKILIVLDQFEQWLHGHATYEGTQLVDALRQCDGEIVQALVLMRDDFWMQITRLFRILEVPLVEGRNSTAIDLFSVAHATSVLGEFGRAYGQLPERESDWSAEQRRFVEQCARILADDERVIPVRLALFAEMIKSKPWSRRTLPAARSSEKLGVDFLEETFGSVTSAPEHRLHRVAARRILERLLPQEGSNIRGHIRSEQELLEYSGYARTPPEFQRIMQILDLELRLVTPTTLLGKPGIGDQASSADTTTEIRYYQLTHDYLVPAIRAWLTSKKRETARGRAELRLADRARAYRDQPHPRQLPSAWEWLSILALTGRRNDNDAERRLMAAANRRHLARLATGAVLAAALIWLASETIGRTRASGYVSSLTTAATADVPAIIQQMAPYRGRARAQMRYLRENGQGKERLHAAMALLPDNQETFEFLLQELVHAEPHSFAAIRDVLARYGDVAAARSRLWAILDNVNQPADRRFRAGMALVSLDGSTPDARWQGLTAFLSAQLAEDLARSPSRFEAWVNALRPKRQLLLADLRRISREKDRGEPARQMAASTLANFFSNDRAVLGELFLDADGAQIVTFLEALTIHRDQAQGAMRSALATRTNASVPETQELAAARTDYESARQAYDAQTNGAAKAFEEAGSRLQRAAAAWEDTCDQRARRVANAAVAVFTWDTHTNALVPLLAQQEDPRVRTYLIDRVGRDAVAKLDVQAALGLLQAGEGDPAVLQAHVLLLGQSPSKLDRSVQAALSEQLLDTYRSHPDSGVHSAAEWTLNRFGMAQRLKSLNVELASEGIREDCNWYVTPSGHTMIVITPTERVTLGSPAEELDRDTDEGESLCRIPRRFAISAKEVSQAQYLEYRDDFPHVPNEAAPSADCPVNAVHWYNASSYCRWLSTQDQFSDQDMCYPPFIRQGLRPYGDYLQRGGYRLPTESEWEVAARAGSKTRFYYGHDAGMLGSYAWHLFNAGGKAHPVGEMMPNRLGFFDIQGNVSEWCFETYVATRAAETEDFEDTGELSNGEPRAVRGASFAAPSTAHRSANRRGDYPGTGSLQIGFRIARTLEPFKSEGPQE